MGKNVEGKVEVDFEVIFWHLLKKENMKERKEGRKKFVIRNVCV